MNKQIKLEKIFPGFQYLSKSEQEGYANQLEENTSLKEWLNSKPSKTYSVDSNFATRNLERLADENELKTAVHAIISLPVYQEIKNQIIISKIKNLSLDLDILSVEEQNFLLNRSYSDLPFPDDWLEHFFQDESFEIKTIKEKFRLKYLDDFGFLFKTNSLKFYYEIEQKVLQVAETEKIKLYIQLLDQDWQNNSNILNHLIKPVGQAVSYWMNPWVKQVKQYMDEMISAHVFYRFFGISSDHVILGTSLETPTIPFVNILDYYNYHNNRKSIHSAMNVWDALLKPLRPFFHEYVELAKAEKNLLTMIIRAFMPFLIMALVLSMGYAVVLPLAYHQLIEYVFFIPTLYFAIAIASQYIQLKNYFYFNLIEWYFGSIYASPTFQSNPALLDAFKTQELSDEVAKYYILSLQQCDRLEKLFHAHAHSLTSQQMSNRSRNLQFKSDLIAEWQDFKNGSLGVEQIPRIVQSRLSAEKNYIKDILKQLYLTYFQLNDTNKQQFKEEYVFLKNKFLLVEDLKSKLTNVELTSNLEDQEDDSWQRLLRMV